MDILSTNSSLKIILLADRMLANATIIAGVPLHIALSDYEPITIYENSSSYPPELQGCKFVNS